MSDISVIICTHNPRPDYLRRVLSALRAQSLPADRWELIVIDNASVEATAMACDLAWHRGARVVREDVLGLTPARLRGISESCGELLVFVDDDNVLAPNFLEEAWSIYAAHPYLGAFGAGQLDPEFEIEPPATIRPYLRMLALRNTRAATWSNNTNDNQSIPWGAGLCISRSVARLSRPFVERLDVTSVLGRRGEDLFVTTTTCSRGWPHPRAGDSACFLNSRSRI